MYKVPDTRMNWFEYENIQQSLQCKHANMLRNKISINESACKWVKPGEQIVLNGFIIKRGFFYVGEYFEIPRAFKNNIIEYNNQQYNKQYKLSRIYGPVIQENLPIENGNLIIEPFSCYYDMHPTHRYEYLSWLAGNVSSCDLSTASLYFHLLGLQMRMFVDDTTDNSERIEIIKHAIELYVLCYDNGIINFEFEQFIEAAISNFFPNNVFEIIHSDIVCNINSDNRRVNALHEICLRIINKYKQCNIPNFLVTDSLFQQAALFFETEFVKYVKGEKSEVLEGYIYVSNDYPIFRMSGVTCDALFCSDYLINVKLKENYLPICSIINKSLKFFFKNTVRQLSEYKSLCKISPTLSLFTLPLAFNYCDYEDAVSYIDKLKRKTETQQYTIISTNYILGVDDNIKVEIKFDKSQITSIIKCIRKIGYGIIPNMLVDDTRLKLGDECIIYRENDEKELDYVLLCRMESIIKVCVYIIGESRNEYDMSLIDKFIENEVSYTSNQRYLMGYLRWLLLKSSHSITRKDKNNIEDLSTSQIKQLIVTLIGLTCSNSQLVSKRIGYLNQILPLFKLPPKIINTLIHRISVEDEEFVTIAKENSATEYTIDNVVIDKQFRVSLNNERLAKVEKQTKQAQELLSKIFEDNEEVTDLTKHESQVFLSILKILLEKELWTRNDVEKICLEHGLMVGSVLEQINDYSYNRIDDAVIEDDGDNIYVMTDYKNKLI